MDLIRQLRQDDVSVAPGANRSSVIEFGHRVYMMLGIATAPFLLPFSVNSFVQDRPILGISTLVVVTLLVANAFSIRRRGRILVPLVFLYMLIVSTFLWGFATIGAVVAFWCYPAALVVLFVAERRQARAMIGIGIVLLVPGAFLWMSTEFATRFAITYVMACYFGDLVVKLLNDLQAQLTGLAITDPLTGAYNRRHLQTCAANAIEQNQRGLGSVSLIAIDVDHFKNINDSRGHEAGDNVLKGLVQELHQRKRKLDAVFRIGGEEFMVLAYNIAPGQAGIFAESLRVHVEQAELLDGQPVTVSLGVAAYEEGEDIESWSRRADANLYEAKQHGRNRVWPTPEAQKGETRAIIDNGQRYHRP